MSMLGAHAPTARPIDAGPHLPPSQPLHAHKGGQGAAGSAGVVLVLTSTGTDEYTDTPASTLRVPDYPTMPR
jgi:hypothetical protein